LFFAGAGVFSLLAWVSADLRGSACNYPIMVFESCRLTNLPEYKKPAQKLNLCKTASLFAAKATAQIRAAKHPRHPRSSMFSLKKDHTPPKNNHIPT